MIFQIVIIPCWIQCESQLKIHNQIRQLAVYPPRISVDCVAAGASPLPHQIYHQNRHTWKQLPGVHGRVTIQNNIIQESKHGHPHFCSNAISFLLFVCSVYEKISLHKRTGVTNFFKTLDINQKWGEQKPVWSGVIFARGRPRQGEPRVRRASRLTN